MATPKLGPDQIAWLVGQVAQYIAAQRAKYAPRANTLSAEQRAAMTGFFPSAVLETGLVQLQNERVQNPDFYPTLRQMGFGNLPDQSAMGAILLLILIPHNKFSAKTGAVIGAVLLLLVILRFEVLPRLWKRD